MKKKIDLFWYWFIFVVAFVLCFFTINDKEVNAYFLNDDGNIQSENLYDNSFNYCKYSFNAVCNVNNNSMIISVDYDTTGSYNFGYSLITNDIIDTLTIGETYTFSLFTENNDSPQSFALFYGNGSIYDNSRVYNSRYITYTVTENRPLYLGVYVNNTNINSITINNIMVTKGSIVPTSFIPFGIWYSQSNLNTEKEISYEEGYNAGIVANNTAPSFYFDEVTSIMEYRILGNTSYYFWDNMSKVTGYNSIINFSELLGVQYGSAYVSQYYWTELSLVNTINVSDTLVFNFSDIGNAPDFSTKTVITFSSSSSCYDMGNGGTVCPNYATFTYDELLQNNFTLKLEDFAELENVTEIDTIGVRLYYNGTRSFGLLTLEDETLTGDITSDYEIGYRVGFITGEQSGVIKGETIGYDKGYSEGYRKASQVVKDPGNNTLVGMVSVLMGMPVNMLVSIYDFEFLGINLAEFFFSLITLLVSIWLIKKLL